MDNLYLIIPYFNYNNSKYSYQNLQNLLNDKFEDCVRIVLVEGILDGQKPLSNLPKTVYKHMVFNLPQKIWVQHNLVNLALRNLEDWEYAVWVDRDIIFTDPLWSSKIIKKLKSGVDILQPFSECIFLNENMQPCIEQASTFFTNTKDIDQNFKIISYMKSVKDGIKCDRKKIYRHPGQTWAISKPFFQKINGIFDKGILGANDMITCFMIDPSANWMNYYSLIFKWEFFKKKFEFRNVVFDYIDGLIMHRYHGSTSGRKYFSRYSMLINDKLFNSSLDIAYNNEGVLYLTKRGLRFYQEIELYFSERAD